MDPSLEKIEQEGKGGRCRQKEVSFGFGCVECCLRVCVGVFRARRTIKSTRAIVGASLDDIKLKRAAAAKAQKASPATEAALKEVKDRTKTAQVKSAHGHMNAAVPKHQKSATFNARGGTRR